MSVSDDNFQFWVNYPFNGLKVCRSACVCVCFELLVVGQLLCFKADERNSCMQTSFVFYPCAKYLFTCTAIKGIQMMPANEWAQKAYTYI